MDELEQKLYKVRFDNDERKKKENLWEILVKTFLQKYVNAEEDVLDVGGGYCEFINAIQCHNKYVVDINPEVRNYANKNVTVLLCPAHDIKELPDRNIDVAFASNFFEHINSKKEVLNVIQEINRVLKPGGKFLIIQPNIKYAYKEYWDFFDHHIPFTEKSFSEALRLNKFEIIDSYPRFLPYTTKTRLSRFALLLKIYLAIPVLWRIFGKQFFIVAKKTA